MHARNTLIAAALLSLSATYAAAEPVAVQSRTNLRAGPGPAFAVIAVMPAGSRMDAQKCTDEWCRVKFGRQVGYINRSVLRSGINSFASAAAAAPTASAPPEPKATLTGPSIWQWRDSDWRNDHWRRIEWHNRMSRH